MGYSTISTMLGTFLSVSLESDFFFCLWTRAEFTAVCSYPPNGRYGEDRDRQIPDMYGDRSWNIGKSNEI